MGFLLRLNAVNPLRLSYTLGIGPSVRRSTNSTSHISRSRYQISVSRSVPFLPHLLPLDPRLSYSMGTSLPLSVGHVLIKASAMHFQELVSDTFNFLYDLCISWMSSAQSFSKTVSCTSAKTFFSWFLFSSVRASLHGPSTEVILVLLGL